MTQKGSLFKGQQKRRTIPPNRHGKTSQTRKGKKYLKPSKISKEMETDRELSKFINHCNEIKATTAASKEGGQLNILKPETNASTSAKTQEKS
ncbi:uncharacterized protein LOC121981073 [Zingiber officinale]|uniref:uncharacterized protein LOC121981073 n=1 Tax=Zingiber officinale TaxID=94328 RepID=UPI001C4D6519|nr:uncharacterized protein LOC121981073 [Zingiber officinale]